MPASARPHWYSQRSLSNVLKVVALANLTHDKEHCSRLVREGGLRVLLDIAGALPPPFLHVCLDISGHPVAFSSTLPVHPPTEGFETFPLSTCVPSRVDTSHNLSPVAPRRATHSGTHPLCLGSRVEGWGIWIRVRGLGSVSGVSSVGFRVKFMSLAAGRVIGQGGGARSPTFLQGRPLCRGYQVNRRST